jgi:dsDNA-binding SOS-regulon protein
MLEVLQKIDTGHRYRILGYKSLYQYAVIALKLSESRAYSFILVSRKAAQIDKLKDAFKKNEITLSKAKRISSVINSQNAEEWLDRAKKLSQRMLERAVVKVNPQMGIQEGTRFIAENTLELKIAITPQTERRLKRAQDLLCQKKNRAVNLEETLREMLTLFLDKNDPVVKASRVLKTAKTTNKSQSTVNSNSKKEALSERTTLQSSLKHQLFLRDQGRCQERDPLSPEGICGDSRWIDSHHIVRVHEGGLNTLENLVLLCRAHHQIEHLRDTR